jgi:hypothetical protein
MMRGMRISAPLVVLGLFLLAATADAGAPPDLAAAALESGMTQAEVAGAANQPVARIYAAESTGRQVTVVGIAKINAPPKTVLADLDRRYGVLKSESLRAVGVFSNPAKPSDVAKYRMPEDDLETLVDCEVGRCKFKIGERGVEAVGEIDWSQPDAFERVNELMKQGMLNLALGYEERGHAALLVSVDKPERQSFADGAEHLVAQLGLTKRLIPKLDEHLVHYPKQRLPGARDRILWTIRNYGYRPVTSIVHSIIYEPPGANPAALIVLKTLYANHYFHARQRLIGLWADDANPGATWVGYSDRLLFDDDVGSIKRRMLQAGIVKNAVDRLVVLRAQHE